MIPILIVHAFSKIHSLRRLIPNTHCFYTPQKRTVNEEKVFVIFPVISFVVS